MGPSQTERALPARGPATGLGARRRAGRGWIIAGTALVACAAVVGGVLLTEGTDKAEHAQPAAGPATGPSGGQTAVGGGAPSGQAHGAPALPAEVVDRELAKVLEDVKRLDETVWAKEVKAQAYEEYFIDLWDDVRAAKDKFGVLEWARFDTFTYGTPAATKEHDWDVKVTTLQGTDKSLDSAGWREMVQGMRAAGYRLTEIEFHQSAFEDEPGKPARSTVSTVLHLVNDKLNSRTAVRAKLQVEWADEPDKSGRTPMYLPRNIVATDVALADRAGGVAFEPVALPGGTAERGLRVDEFTELLIAYDLDGDGRSELVMPAENRVLWNRGGWRFEPEPLFRAGTTGQDQISAGVIGDFTGDGLPDLLCGKAVEMFLVRGEAGGRFSAAPPERAVQRSQAFAIRALSTLTAGDVDGDGDLDVWAGQYKTMYVGGNMPTPYYDANDGHPAALLINDGTGHFTDATEAAGLAPKRFRRTFGGSLVDLDGDRDLDLLVNSDFAGLDVYYNDGRGRFTDVTDAVVDERHNFGMGHTFADFNLDGRVDMYTIGMSSTTARRLSAMGLGREEFPTHQEKRPQMGYGNRMFFAPPPHSAPGAAPARFQQPAFKDDVARTGWSWGTTSPDFDNDGDADIFVGNGMVSGKSCRDYCTTYWRRDVYLGSSKEDAVMKQLFDKHGMTSNVSWNGFEHDVLFMNEGGKSFINVAHLMGVAFEADTRGVISDDLDGDGRMDLVVAEQSVRDKTRYVHVYKNTWPTKLNWIGVRLAESKPGLSPLGAEVRVYTAGGRVQPARVVTGDSFATQHAAAKHFGLGTLDRVEAIEVTWPNGQVTRVDNPPINQWHRVAAAGTTTAAATPR